MKSGGCIATTAMSAEAAAGEPIATGERETLLGLTLRRLAERDKPLQPLSRLCIVGASSGPGQASNWHERALRSIAADADSDDAHAPLTGLFLVLPTGWIHFVEGSLPGLSAYVRLLREEEAAGGAVRGVKVASCMDDVPSRTFSRWNSTKLDVPRSNYVEVNSDTLPKLLADTVLGLLKIGKALGPFSTDQAGRKLADWKNIFADAMPSNERVQQMLDLEELPTLAEFITTFDAVTDIVLSADQVWPAEQPLLY